MEIIILVLQSKKKTRHNSAVAICGRFLLFLNKLCQSFAGGCTNSLPIKSKHISCCWGERVTGRLDGSNKFFVSGATFETLCKKAT